MPTKQESTNGKMTTGAKVGLGAASLAALAAAAAGAFYFYGSKDAAKNRKKMRGWMIKARGEVVERMEKMKDMSEDNYNTVVGQVMDKYKKIKNIDPQEITELAADMRKHWKNISGHLKAQTAPKRKPAAKKAAKPAAK